MTDGEKFRPDGSAMRCAVRDCKRGHRRACLHAPNLSFTDWLRLHTACPIKNAGTIHNGDFLIVGNVSQTQLSIARHAGGCTINNRAFIYLPQHDFLVRSDFHAWAMQNWRAVLWGDNAECARETKR